MTPQETLKQIKSLTETFVGLSLSNEQNFPTTKGNFKRKFEISVSTDNMMSVALKNIAYREIYLELEKAKCFNVKMLDGALIALRYRFLDGAVFEHSLSYFPAPDLEIFQNASENYWDDEIYADVIDKNIVPFPIRFDFSNDSRKFVDVEHPHSHLTLGQYQRCRIPVCSPLGPLMFGEFILRNFYNTAFRKFSERFPKSEFVFSKTITTAEKKIPHFVCGN